ncbi:MAG TPA: phosphate acetyltransferase [Pseudoclavibacter sp.]|nr:phosphate acetyltransferase [Pseudoclavibacter sp.]
MWVKETVATTGIYVTSMATASGKKVVCLGLVDMLRSRAERIGYFRPVASTDVPDDDPMVQLVRRRFGLSDAQSRAAVGAAEFSELLSAGKRDVLAEKALAVYSEIAANADIVIVEGTDLAEFDAVVETEFNTQVAKDLGTPVIAVVNAKHKSVEETVGQVDTVRHDLIAEGCQLFAVIVSRVNPVKIPELKDQVHVGASGRPVYFIPEIPELKWPSVAEVKTQTGAEHIAGPADFNRDVKTMKVGAMTVDNFIDQLEDGAFVVSPGDRLDILFATLASSLSATFPTPSALLLTGSFPLSQKQQQLLSGAQFPVLSLPLDTYEAAEQISQVTTDIGTSTDRKIATALGVWDANVDADEIAARVSLPRPSTMTPLRFTYTLVERARASKAHIVLPEGDDLRILTAAENLHRRDIVALTILGKPEKVLSLAAANGIDLSGIDIIDPETSPLREDFAHEYAKLRAHKGVTYEQAYERVLDVSYFGTMMVHRGLVGGMVSGASHTTAHTIKPSFEIIKTRPGTAIVSSVFLMCLADRVLVYGDCAVNPDPTAEQLADIAAASAQTATVFGIDPRIAMLSYSTGTSGHGQSVDKVREATELVQAKHPELNVDGPIQYDAASNPSIGGHKLPGSTVAGNATVFIFPDLDTGNNTYKAVQQSSGALALGPILQGLNKPVNDLSRGCTVEDVINTIVITAIQAAQ